MRNRRIKKLVSLTLAAIMAFTINTGVYAEEIEDSVVVAEDASVEDVNTVLDAQVSEEDGEPDPDSDRFIYTNSWQIEADGLDTKIKRETYPDADIIWASKAQSKYPQYCGNILAFTHTSKTGVARDCRIVNDPTLRIEGDNKPKLDISSGIDSFDSFRGETIYVDTSLMEISQNDIDIINSGDIEQNLTKVVNNAGEWWKYYLCNREVEIETVDYRNNELMPVTISLVKDTYIKGQEKTWLRVQYGPAKSAQEAKKDEHADKLKNNEITGEVQKEFTADGKACAIKYSAEVPFYGKSFKAKDYKDIIGDCVVSVNGVQYTIEKVKVVYVKGASSASYNASLVITKLSGGTDKKARKEAQRAINKLTKAGKKTIGKLPIRIYPVNLTTGVSTNAISIEKITGTEDKPIVTFKLRNGKKYFVKTGMKDMAGEAEKVTYDSKTKFITVESNDFTGSFPVSAAKANKMKAAK